MKKIRNSVFETNSSSTHSISLSDIPLNNDVMQTLPIDENGVVTLRGGEYGWEQQTYDDAIDKANYALVYVMDWSGERSEEFQKILKDVIIGQTGCSDVVFEGVKRSWSDNLDFGYIDHQSVEDNDLHHLFEDSEKLRQFIFNPMSILETDNDNH
jgi:hypothetical protein